MLALNDVLYCKGIIIFSEVYIIINGCLSSCDLIIKHVEVFHGESLRADGNVPLGIYSYSNVQFVSGKACGECHRWERNEGIKAD